MKLQSLKSFEVLNNETIKMITGGTAITGSKKGDVTSTSQDSKTDDGSPSFA
jgi:hypothetical protein